ncbi:hypothetical protein LCGC14_1978270 [marine sediment metagenome]|uniref:Uncharacterized protein n=1 Tax=marine sediment metagenome TaxID=412755 RepID=A0A0F9F9M3_9ZZZZ
MEEEEFLKEHPGLKGKCIVGDAYTSKDIHKTQLDKQKVKEVIEENLSYGDAKNLKKELGFK